ncbi:MAG: hypothetical protein J6A59_01550 [Lachnospiraceae bacterium]|nr:hypothetical protein [Lachnospiraceae bacterium]
MGKIVVNCNSLYDCPYRWNTFNGQGMCSCGVRKNTDTCMFLEHGHCKYVITLKVALKDMGISQDKKGGI